MKTRNLRKEAKRRTGPGTPDYRFGRIMDELEKRWPDPEPYSARAGEGRYFQMIDEERRSKDTALQAAITALDDWLNIYAPEFCNPQRVAEAQERVGSVGTIGYIAEVVAQCRAALTSNPRNDQDSDEDR